MDDQVRFEIPYFAHDVLDPKIYPKGKLNTKNSPEAEALRTSPPLQ